MIISKNNFFETGYSSLSFTSETTNHEFTNAELSERRAKTWRTSGYWVIVAGDNTLTLKESAIGTLTVTLTAGSYTTAQLQTHLKAQFDAAGASTYTVTRSFEKWVIGSDLMGGDNLFEVPWTDSPVLADTLGYVYDDDTPVFGDHTADLVRIHSYEEAQVDLGTATKIYVACILGPNNQDIGLMPDAVVTLYGNSTSDFTSPEYTVAMTGCHNSFSYVNKDGIGTYRHWKIRIVDHNTAGYSSINLIHLGDSIDFETGAVQFPFDQPIEDFSTQVRSESGHLFVDKKSLTTRYSFDVQFLTKSEMQDLRDYLMLIGLSENFIMCFDPDEVITNDSSKLVKMVKQISNPTLRMDFANRFSVGLSLEEVI